MAFRAVRVKFVVLIAVIFQQNNRVFALGHFQVGFGTVQTKHIGTGAISCRSRSRITVNSNKKVGFIFICYLCTLVQLDKHIGFTGINNVNIRKISMNILSQFKCHRKGYILFVGFTGAYGAGVFTPVAGINNNSFNGKTITSKSHCGY